MFVCKLNESIPSHSLIPALQTADALNYLHSKKFIYRDLKPANVLVWKYPTPQTQWSPQACVFVKLADYGISKEVTPQGIRGVEGTRPYLAPEVTIVMHVHVRSTYIHVIMASKWP